MTGRGFYYPVDVGIATNGHLYVLGRGHEADTRGIQVCIMDHNGGYYGIFGSVGEGDGQFIWPTSIVVDSQGDVYVSDEYLNRISVFDPSGKFIRKWGTSGNATGELNGPSGMALDANGNLYIVDHKNSRVQKFSQYGDCLHSFGINGHNDGQLKMPWGITVAPNGDVYVSDWGNDRIQRFTADGSFVSTIGNNGDGQLCRPAGVAVDQGSFVYVADWGNNLLQVFDGNGNFVTSAKGEATLSTWAEEYLNSNLEEKEARKQSDLEPDLHALNIDRIEDPYHTEKYFWAPISVKLDASENLLVTDRNRHRIQVYKLT